MKKNIFLIFCLFTSLCLNAQVQSKKKGHSSKVDSTIVQNNHKVVYYSDGKIEYYPIKQNKKLSSPERFESIKAVNDYLEAIDIKINWVKNNPEEHEKALNSGWYELMEEAKQKAEEEKIRLSKNSKN